MSRPPDVPHFSLIQQIGLAARLREELGRAAREFGNDPAGFVRDLFRSDTKDAKRRRRIYIGLATAFVAHAMLLTIIAIAGWHRVAAPTDDPRPRLTWVGPSDAPLVGPTSGSKSEPPRGEDGGGGGQNDPLPVPRGPRPFMAPIPQIVQPTPTNIENPSLTLPSTIVGPPDDAPPPPDARLGDPKGKEGDPSGGPGSGGGLGSSSGTGAGSGTGPGYGRDSGGGAGGKGLRAGSREGTSANVSPLDWSRDRFKPGFSSFSWIYRPRPIVTPEAQENKSLGTVLLRATFRADGTIADIEIIQRVEFMTDSAVDALRRSKFRPATMNGVPVTLRNVLVKIDVHY